VTGIPEPWCGSEGAALLVRLYPRRGRRSDEGRSGPLPPADPERQILLPVLRPQAFSPLQMQRWYTIIGLEAAQAVSSRMLEKSASGVLASLRSSTYPEGTLLVFTRCGLAGQPFEHPARCPPVCYTCGRLSFHRAMIVFPQPASRLKPVENRV